VLVGLTAGLITGVVYNHAEWFFTGGHCIETAIGSDSVLTNRDACASVTALDDGIACAAIMGADGVSEGVCTYIDDRVCMSSILMGTLYWFFYGTRAFSYQYEATFAVELNRFQLKLLRYVRRVTALIVLRDATGQARRL